MVKGIIFNIQRYSIEDGPGIRTTVFLKGCPLRCAWCANPESQKLVPEVAHRDSLCNKCAECVRVCEPKAIAMADAGVKIDRRSCTNCGECVKVCSPGALNVYGREATTEEVFQEVVRDQDYYRNSGGGVTASGGEPLLQPDFVAELFERCHAQGIHTALETCGDAKPESLEQVLKETDLVLYDLKLMDPSAHRKWTKRSNQQILRNLETIVAKGIPVLIRVPLIPAIIDTEENLRAIARHVLGLGNGTKVELLPYHQFGMSKYGMLDRPYEIPDLKPQQKEALARSGEIVTSLGVECEAQE